MITLLRSDQRHVLRGRGRNAWQTFQDPPHTGVIEQRFEAILGLDEIALSPGARLKLRSSRAIELVTYVFNGSIATDDGGGRCDVLQLGEFQRTHINPRTRYSETNAAATEPARVFHLRFRSLRTSLELSCEHKRFSAAQKRGVLCPVASMDGRDGTLTIEQDAVIYSALLDAGQHRVHELGAAGSAWLHVVRGELLVSDILLAAGDGLGATAERAVSFTSRASSEILLVSLGGGTRM